MASIQTGIELNDQFTNVTYGIINSVNLAMSTMSNMQQSLNADVNISSMEGAKDEINQATAAYMRFTQTVEGTESCIGDNVDEQGRFNREIQNGASQANDLINTIKGAAAAHINIQSVGEILNLSDTMTQTTARLDLIVDDGSSVDELQNKIYVSAQSSRSSFLATADAVSKLGMQASQAFSSNDELIGFTELLNKSFVNTGISVQGIDSIMSQFTQAMASGSLQGEELNAVLDNAAPIAQNIQKYMEEVMGVDASNIKELASEGMITAEIMKNAMFYAADDINAKFEQMPMTWEQVGQSIQNTALMAFQPVLQRVNDIANSEAFQTFVNSAIEGISVLANIVMSMFDLMGQAGVFIADNWSIIEPIVYGVIAALAAYIAISAFVATVNGITAASQAIHAAATMMATGKTLAETAAQHGLNAALLACPITWIILLIIALIAIFYAVVAAVNKFSGSSLSATGLIAGAFATLGAHVINTFVVPAWNMIAAFVNFFGNVFNDPIAAVKVLFYDMCLIVLGYIRNLATGIESLLNKIPGVTVDITSGLDDFYSELEQKQQEVKDESEWVEYVKEMEYLDYEKAFNKGYSVGEDIADKISNFNLSDLFGATELPPSEDNTGYTNVIEDSGMDENLESIAGDTGNISDAMDISGEDLKYLRDIAEQEAINRYTVAEVTIDQSGMQNTIKNGNDIDGFMSQLTDSVNEAVDSITEGVHK